MSALHTPGDWQAVACDDGFQIRYNDFGNWLETVWEDGDGHAQADARLIAAAPDLLKCAMGLGAMPEGYCFCSSSRIGDDSKVHEPECRDLRTAIAKATGQ